MPSRSFFLQLDDDPGTGGYKLVLIKPHFYFGIYYGTRGDNSIQINKYS